MNWWIALIIGLIIGWLIELLIDYFYWRPKRICTDAERNLEASLSQAQTENRNLATQLDGFRIKGQELTEFETSLQVKEAELTQLSAGFEEREKAFSTLVVDLETKEADLNKLSARYDQRTTGLVETEAELQARITDLDKLSSSYAVREQELATLAAALEARETELGRLSATANTRESQLTEWAERLRVKESELQQLSQSTENRQRELADLKAQSKTGEIELANAQGIISSLQDRIRGLEAKLADREESRKNGDSTPAVAAGVAATGAAIGVVASETGRRVKAPQIDRFDSGLEAGSVPVAGTGTPASTIEVLFDGQPRGTTVVSDNGRWSMSVNVPQEGPYNVQARAIDTTGKVLAAAPQRRVYIRQPQIRAEPRMTAASGRDDLQKVWGIGPQIDKVLRANGINTFVELAETPVSRLDEILRKAGRRFRISKQDTWAEQARLAAAGRWQELKEMQKHLDWKGQRRKR